MTLFYIWIPMNNVQLLLRKQERGNQNWFLLSCFLFIFFFFFFLLLLRMWNTFKKYILFLRTNSDCLLHSDLSSFILIYFIYAFFIEGNTTSVTSTAFQDGPHSHTYKMYNTYYNDIIHKQSCYIHFTMPWVKPFIRSSFFQLLAQVVAIKRPSKLTWKVPTTGQSIPL